MEPPLPGPYSGVPCGGIGGGCIGRGYRGDFRRWSLFPGRYIHNIIYPNQFCIRIKRRNRVFSRVLSVFDGSQAGDMRSWHWSVPPESVEYFGLFPRAWTVIKSPVPDTTVTIRQVSPVIPHNYSDTSLPTVVFHVVVENTAVVAGTDTVTEDVEASVMFTFQSGFEEEAVQVALERRGGEIHCPFSLPLASPEAPSSEETEGEVVGVAMTYSHYTYVPASSPDTPPPVTASNNNIPLAISCRPCSRLPSDLRQVRDQGSFSIAAVHKPHEQQAVSVCGMFVVDSSSRGNGKPTVVSTALEPEDAVSAQELWDRFTSTGGLYTLDTPATSFRESTSTSACQTSRPGDTVASAVCIRSVVPAPALQSAPVAVELSFALAWDFPVARFGSGHTVDRFYTKFFGGNGGYGHSGYSGYSSPLLAAFSLQHASRWERAIHSWQAAEQTDGRLAVLAGESFPYLRSQLFNELYFLVDGGTIWCRGGGGKEGSSKGRPGVAGEPISTVISPLSPLSPTLSESMARGEAPSGAPAPPTDSSDSPSNSIRVKPMQSTTRMAHAALYTPSEDFETATAVTAEDLQRILNGQKSLARNLGKLYTEMVAHDAALNRTLSRLPEDPDIRLQISSSESTGLANGSGNGNGEAEADAGADTDLLLTPTNIQFSFSSGSAGSASGLLSNRASLSEGASRGLPSAPSSMASAATAASVSVGRFLYLEGHEYLMYNTYDVHHYAGFALLSLWPLLELSIQRDIATAVSAEDPSLRVMLGSGDVRPRKLGGVVPHDLGSPSDLPWARTNVYNFQDVSKWKDLGPKFALQVYRDHLCTGAEGRRFLAEVYPTVLRVMLETRRFDTDGDGMIENQGFPDQTYDIWAATGVHAYCGGLWVGACHATAAMAEAVGDADSHRMFSDLAQRGTVVYNRELWNPQLHYFNLDNSESSYHNSIMADMLAGHFFALCCGLPPVVSAERAYSSYCRIFENNVVAFGKGKLIGAVNGMRPTSPPAVDSTCLQSREVWTGTTYALAAGMVVEALLGFEGAMEDLLPLQTPASLLQEERRYEYTEGGNGDEEGEGGEGASGRAVLAPKYSDLKDMSPPTSPSPPDLPQPQSAPLRYLRHRHGHQSSLTPAQRSRLLAMALSTAQGIHDGGWKEFGYWFATPEGWEQSGNYRSLGYMRALAIWAIHFCAQDSVLDRNSSGS